MSMERWNPYWEAMRSRQRSMERMFDEGMNEWFDRPAMRSNNLELDVHETANAYEIEAAMPGFHADDIDIEIRRDTVVLKGNNQQNNERRDENRNYIYRERRSGSFYRTIQLPEMLDAERAEARLNNGVLHISIPKMAQTQSRRLKVSGSPSALNLAGQATQTGGNPLQQGAVNMKQSEMYQNSNEGITPSGAGSKPNPLTQTTPTAPNVVGDDMGTANPDPKTDHIGASSTNTQPPPAKPTTNPNMPQSGSNQQFAPQNRADIPVGGATVHTQTSGDTGTNAKSLRDAASIVDTEPGPNLTNYEAVSPGNVHMRNPTVQPDSKGGEAKRGLHSEVDHRPETGGETYTSGGHRQSSPGPGTSDAEAQRGAGDYGAGQTSGNVSQGSSLGGGQ